MDIRIGYCLSLTHITWHEWYFCIEPSYSLPRKASEKSICLSKQNLKWKLFVFVWLFVVSFASKKKKKLKINYVQTHEIALSFSPFKQMRFHLFLNIVTKLNINHRHKFSFLLKILVSYLTMFIKSFCLPFWQKIRHVGK